MNEKNAYFDQIYYSVLFKMCDKVDIQNLNLKIINWLK